MNRYGATRVRRGVKHFIVGKVISSIAGISGLVLVVRGLSVEAFADYAILIALVELLSAISGVGVVHALLRFVPELYGAHYQRALSRLVWGAIGLRTGVLFVLVLAAYGLTGQLAGLIGLAGAEAAFSAFLIVVLIRSTAHLVSQVLESTLHQSYAQAGFTLATVARLAGVIYLGATGEMSLVNVIWVEAASEALGVGVMLVGVFRVVRIGGVDPAPEDDDRWLMANFRRVVRFGLSGYLQHLLILPYGGHTNRLIGGHLLASHPMAAFGFAQSLYEYGKRYLPAQLLIGLIRPVVLDRFVKTRDFVAANRTMTTVFKLNALMIGPALAYLPVAGVETLLLVSGDKYGPRAGPMLFVMAIMLLLETVRMQLEVLTQAVERYDNLVPANLLLSLSVIPAVALLPVLGPIAFPLSNTLGLIVSNHWVIRMLRKQGYHYSYDRTTLFRVAGIVLFGMASGWVVKMMTGVWWLGGIAALVGYVIAFMVRGKEDIKDFRRILAKGEPEDLLDATGQSHDSKGATINSTRLPAIGAVIRHEIYLDVGGGADDVVLVAGTGRSGTTWVGDVIASATSGRVVFEPFIWARNEKLLFAGRYRISQLSGRLNFSGYVHGGEPDIDSYTQDVEGILAGRVRGFWVNQETKPQIYRKRVIKDIRANLMLPWLAKTWPGMKVVFVIRNPAKVVDSMIERTSEGWGFDWTKDEVLSQPELMRDYLNPFLDLIEQAETQVERLALRWCIENYVPLKQISALPNVMVVRYEELAGNASVWESIQSHIGWSGWSKNKLAGQIGRRSHTSSHRRPLNGNHDDAFLHLNASDRDTIRRYAERFGLEEYC